MPFADLQHNPAPATLCKNAHHNSIRSFEHYCSAVNDDSDDKVYLYNATSKSDYKVLHINIHAVPCTRYIQHIHQPTYAYATKVPSQIRA